MRYLERYLAGTVYRFNEGKENGDAVSAR